MFKSVLPVSIRERLLSHQNNNHDYISVLYTVNYYNHMYCVCLKLTFTFRHIVEVSACVCGYVRVSECVRVCTCSNALLLGRLAC